MKMNKIYAWMAAAMTLAACSTNDIADLGGNDANNVVNVAATRANTSSNSNAIKAFHLVNTTQQSEYDKKYEADYKYDDASSTYVMTNGTVLWCNTDDNEGNKVENVFKAFTPLTTAANLASYDRFYIPIYQASPELLAAADWMTATATSTKAAATDGLSLNFEHRNAKLHFDVTVKDDAAALTSEDITVIGNITPYYSANESNKTIEAIVAPVSADEITSSTSRPTLISFRLAGGDEISVPLPTSISQIEAGKQYNFSITVGHNTLTISSVSVTDWTAATVTPGKEDEASCADEDIDYITFTAESEQQIKVVYYDDDPRDELDPTNPYGDQSYAITRSTDTYEYEYSINNGEWIPFDEIDDSDNVIFGGDKGTLRLRGKNTSGTNKRVIVFKNETKVACTGDIRTLLDYESYKTVDTRDANFNFLFIYCKQLISAPKLPCMNLDKECYEGMFYGCTSLVEAPALPATTLAVSCYENMFNGCTSLVEAPALPATTLANYCYESMFEDCSSLKVAPALPATELAESCYKSMFDGCSSLKVAPALPATELKSTCYAYMFDDCTSLTVTPELPATTLSPYCYNYMFSDCTSLTTAPALPATDLAKSCYSGMFSGCTALTKAPELKASILVTDCYSYIFLGCSNLSSVTMLAEDVNAETCLYLWLENAGTSAQSRTLKLKNATVYNTIINTTYYNRPALPDNWKSGASGTTIIFEE